MKHVTSMKINVRHWIALFFPLYWIPCRCTYMSVYMSFTDCEVDVVLIEKKKKKCKKKYVYDDSKYSIQSKYRKIMRHTFVPLHRIRKEIISTMLQTNTQTRSYCEVVEKYLFFSSSFSFITYLFCKNNLSCCPRWPFTYRMNNRRKWKWCAV